MSFLTINGYAVPSANATPRGQIERIGSEDPAFSGKLISDVRAIIRPRGFETTQLTFDESEALIGLLNAEGHSWDFEDDGASNAWQYSAKGINADTITSATRTTVSPKFGTAALDIANNGTVRWDLDSTNRWTVLFWRDTGSGWEHYAETSDGDAFVDGVAGALDPTLSITSGNELQISNGTGSTIKYDDLVFLPFIATTSMITAFAANDQPFGLQPYVSVSGDAYGGDGKQCRALNIQTSYLQTAGASSWENNKRKVQFILRDEGHLYNKPPAFLNTKSLDLGVTDGVSVTDDATLDFSTTVTGSVWVKFDTLPARSEIVGKYGASDPARSWRLDVISSGNLQFFFTPTIFFNFTTAGITTGTWYHIMFVYDGGEATAADRVKIWLDGTELTTKTVSGTIPTSLTNSTTALEVGGSANGVDGHVEELALFSDAKGASDATTLYSGGSPADLTGMANLVSWWRFEDDLTDTAGSNDGSAIGTVSYATDVPT